MISDQLLTFFLFRFSNRFRPHPESFPEVPFLPAGLTRSAFRRPEEQCGLNGNFSTFQVLLNHSGDGLFRRDTHDLFLNFPAFE